MAKKYKIALVISLGLIPLWFMVYGFRSEAVVVPASYGTAVNAISGNVKVTAVRELRVTAREEGRVVNAFRRKGDGLRTVEKGDRLCRLDTTQLDLELDHVQSELNMVQKQMMAGSPLEIRIEEAIENLEHNRQLFEMGQVSEKSFKHKEQEIQQLTRQIQDYHDKLSLRYASNKRKFDKLQKRRDDCTIRAPINGIIPEFYVGVGQYVNKGAAIARIISSQTRVEVSVSEEDFPGIASGQLVSVNFLGYPNKTYQGKVKSLSATANPNSKRRSVFVTMINEPPGMTAGMTGEASIIKAEREDALIIPRRALHGNAVFAVRKGRVVQVPVKIGFNDLVQAEVLSGLSEGDQVIVEDIQRFREGDRVRLLVQR